MQSFLYYGVLIAHAIGPGALFSPHCTAFSTFVSGAWNALLFNILHVLLMVLAFDAYRTLHGLKISVMVSLHAAAAAFVSLQNMHSRTAARHNGRAEKLGSLASTSQPRS